MDSRRVVLGGVLVVLALLAAVVLAEVFATVFFAITVGYLLTPFHDRLVRRGVSSTWASILATLVAGFAGLLPLAVAGFLLYERREVLRQFLTSLPETITLSVGGISTDVELDPLVTDVSDAVSALAVDAAQLLPSFALKATLFLVVLFSLLVRRERMADALLAVIPRTYHDVAGALHARTRQTLFAIYVLQAGTGVATFVLAVPTFALLGYDQFLLLSFLAGVFQFLPIVGPSLLLLALAATHLATGAALQAALLLVIGGVVIAWTPDLIVRIWLADEASGLPAGLYFVGFVGGLLTTGAVGIIAGPLVVALVVETMGLLAAET